MHEVHGGDEDGGNAEDEGSDGENSGDVGILGEVADNQHHKKEADVVGRHQGAELSAV